MHNKIKTEIKEWIKTIMSAIAIYLILSIFIFSTRVEGLSMYPTFNDGNFLITIRAYLHDEFELGDIIVFDSENLNKVLIKRVIGVSGDTIKIEDGKVYRNGTELKEDYINNITLETLEVTVLPGTYFVMGDNRQNSMDSRYETVGLVKEKDIRGKVLLRIFPSPKIIRKGE